ncbi:MAG: hypothetical protein ABSH46_21610 [Bryobacteraceae bacterium]|jgi:hypothetical protein
MKSLLAVGFFAILSVGALAQHRGDAPVGGALPAVNPFSGSVQFAQRLGATIGGIPSYTGAGRRRYHRRGYVGYVGYGGYPLLYPVFAPPGETYDQAPEQPANQPEAIDQNLGPQPQPGDAGPGVQSYSAPSTARPEPSEDQPLFFIALTDNSVYTAVAYWVEDGTLNYITPQGRKNQVSVTLIDRETTARLNRGSKFQLHLPGA